MHRYVRRFVTYIIMSKNTKAIALLVALMLPASCAFGALRKRAKTGQAKAEITDHSEVPVLWRYPADIRSRNLFYGPGGEKDAPHSVFTFVKEDLDGTNPKFVVRDENGVKWKVKMGLEARPETVASRLVWAVGYNTNEDYFVPKLKVEGMPAHLKRGQNLRGPDDSLLNVRLKRYVKNEKKVGDWQWRHNAFNARELNGLRVMMALINNWDVTDKNNSVYAYKRASGAGDSPPVAMVSDLGASFGTTGRNLRSKDKGSLESYQRSKFITKVTSDYVDFAAPSRPMFIYFFSLPEFVMRVRLRWIGKRIPRQDVHWIGQLLAQLSPQQIRDAFRAAGYSTHDVDNFSQVVEGRIAELERL
jgi:hypothetical protein